MKINQLEKKYNKIMKKSETFNKLYKENSLSKEDVHTNPQGWKILTRSGIEKIQYNNNIDVSFDIISHELDNVVMKATAYMKNKKMESFGSATKENCRNTYKVEMAEKRALARVIIKIMGLTKTLGEDEIKYQK